MQHYQGRGCKEDYNQAATSLLNAEKQFDKLDQHEMCQCLLFLGYCYVNGRGVNKNLCMSSFYFGRAADRGCAISMLVLGTMFKNGKGVEKDNTRAKYFLNKAIAGGSSFALVSLACLYSKGEKDYAKAFELNSKAADIGNKVGMHNVGKAYERGKGVEQDFEKAEQWFLTAIQAGCEDAKPSLSRVRQKMVTTSRQGWSNTIEGGGIRCAFWRNAILFHNFIPNESLMHHR